MSYIGKCQTLLENEATKEVFNKSLKKENIRASLYRRAWQLHKLVSSNNRNPPIIANQSMELPYIHMNRDFEIIKDEEI